MAESINFKVFQKDNFRLTIYYKDSNQEAVNLTDYDVTCTVRDSFGGKVVCAVADLDDGITLVEDEGKISINFTPEKTLKFTVPKAVFQVQVTDPDGIKDTIAYGVLNVEKAAV